MLHLCFAIRLLSNSISLLDSIFYKIFDKVSHHQNNELESYITWLHLQIDLDWIRRAGVLLHKTHLRKKCTIILLSKTPYVLNEYCMAGINRKMFSCLVSLK